PPYFFMIPNQLLQQPRQLTRVAAADLPTAAKPANDACRRGFVWSDKQGRSAGGHNAVNLTGNHRSERFGLLGHQAYIGFAQSVSKIGAAAISAKLDIRNRVLGAPALELRA